MTNLCDDDYVACELAQSDRATLLQMAQRRGACVSDIALEVASQAAGARVFGTGLPPGDFPTPIYDVVMNRITILGSIVGGRQDLAEAIAFAAEGKVHAHTHEMKLEDINQVFLDLRAGKVDGRMVMTF